MPWQSLMAVRRLPVPRCIPVHCDFLTVDNYQHDSRQQNCRGGDDTLLVIAPYFPKTPHNARRNDKRVPWHEWAARHVISIDEPEEMAGLDFLPDLPKFIQDPLEAETPSRLWPIKARDIFGLIRLNLE